MGCYPGLLYIRKIPVTTRQDQRLELLAEVVRVCGPEEFAALSRGAGSVGMLQIAACAAWED
jgi:hypothetical protein